MTGEKRDDDASRTRPRDDGRYEPPAHPPRSDGRLRIDGNVAKPYRVFARDAETGTVRTLSRHTSDLAARRAICRYRRLTGSKGE